MKDNPSDFARLQAGDTRNERRLAWAELLVLVVMAAVAAILVLVFRQ